MNQFKINVRAALDAYQLACVAGFEGTMEEWLIVKGIQGEPGPPGEDGKDGTNFDPDAIGLMSERFVYDTAPEDFSYLAVDEGNLYFRVGPPGDWSDPVSFQGPVGPQGEQGIQGEKGDKGEQGDGSADVLAGDNTFTGANAFTQTISGHITGTAGTVATIAGHLAAGENVILTGTGTPADPAVITAVVPKATLIVTNITLADGGSYTALDTVDEGIIITAPSGAKVTITLPVLNVFGQRKWVRAPEGVVLTVKDGATTVYSATPGWWYEHVLEFERVNLRWLRVAVGPAVVMADQFNDFQAATMFHGDTNFEYKIRASGGVELGANSNLQFVGPNTITVGAGLTFTTPTDSQNFRTALQVPGLATANSFTGVNTFDGGVVFNAGTGFEAKATFEMGFYCYGNSHFEYPVSFTNTISVRNADFSGSVRFLQSATFEYLAPEASQAHRTALGVPGLTTANTFSAANTFNGGAIFNAGTSFNAGASFENGLSSYGNAHFDYPVSMGQSLSFAQSFNFMYGTGADQNHRTALQVPGLATANTLTAANTFTLPIVGSVTGSAATVTTIAGKITAGANVTLAGTGTAADPIVVNAEAGGITNIIGGTNIAVTGAGTAADPLVVGSKGSTVSSVDLVGSDRNSYFGAPFIDEDVTINPISGDNSYVYVNTPGLAGSLPGQRKWYRVTNPAITRCVLYLIHEGEDLGSYELKPGNYIGIEYAAGEWKRIGSGRVIFGDEFANFGAMANFVAGAQFVNGLQVNNTGELFCAGTARFLMRALFNSEIYHTSAVTYNYDPGADQTHRTALGVPGLTTTNTFSGNNTFNLSTTFNGRASFEAGFSSYGNSSFNYPVSFTDKIEVSGTAEFGDAVRFFQSATFEYLAPEASQAHRTALAAPGLATANTFSATNTFNGATAWGDAATFSYSPAAAQAHRIAIGAGTGNGDALLAGYNTFTGSNNFYGSTLYSGNVAMDWGFNVGNQCDVVFGDECRFSLGDLGSCNTASRANFRKLFDIGAAVINPQSVTGPVILNRANTMTNNVVEADFAVDTLVQFGQLGALHVGDVWEVCQVGAGILTLDTATPIAGELATFRFPPGGGPRTSGPWSTLFIRCRVLAADGLTGEFVVTGGVA